MRRLLEALWAGLQGLAILIILALVFLLADRDRFHPYLDEDTPDDSEPDADR